MELEYAKRLDAISVRYAAVDGNGGAAEASSQSPAKLLMLQNSPGTDFKRASSPMPSQQQSGKHQLDDASSDFVPTAAAVSDAASLFFANISFLGKGNAGKVRTFAALLTDSLLEDVESMFAETQSILKDSRVVFRKNRCAVCPLSYILHITMYYHRCYRLAVTSVDCRRAP